MDLKGSKIILTGGSSGLGKQTAKDLILKGAIEYSENGFEGMIFEVNYQCQFLENNDLKLVDEDERSITLIFQN